MSVRIGCPALAAGFAIHHILEQIRQCLHAGGLHVGKLAFMKVPYRLVQLFQKRQAFRGNPGHDDPAVVFLAFARDQSALFHAIEQTRHVRIARNHPIADAAAQQADWFCAPQNAQYVVLGQSSDHAI